MRVRLSINTFWDVGMKCLGVGETRQEGLVEPDGKWDKLEKSKDRSDPPKGTSETVKFWLSVHLKINWLCHRDKKKRNVFKVNQYSVSVLLRIVYWCCRTTDSGLGCVEQVSERLAQEPFPNVAQRNSISCFLFSSRKQELPRPYLFISLTIPAA